jgi:Protein of unknown function (DUF2934)
MHPENRSERIRERAYEIYLSRDPSQGSPEGDWWKAEQEIEREEQFRAAPGVVHPTHWRELLTAEGKDIENPT